MKTGLRLPGVLSTLGLLSVIARLGSVGITVGFAVLLAIVALCVFATRKRPGHRYEKNPSTRADADLQSWWGS